MPFLTVKVTKSIVKRNYTSKIVLVIKYFKILLNILPLKAMAIYNTIVLKLQIVILAYQKQNKFSFSLSNLLNFKRCRKRVK
ncbi:MAG: hypothetical protein BGN92_06700 [Sphingobacteriales bacterium 41-5]|nr:MAG: hypothetical protein BGN92_06700 [Sphingobacteriales bacterium 41-5]